MHKVLANIMVAAGAAIIMTGTAGAAAQPSPTNRVAVGQPAGAPAAAAPATKQPEPKAHEVQAGDSLSSIAESEGLESWRPLWNANSDLQDPDLIYAGQKLTVPQGPTEDRPLPQAVAAPPAQPMATTTRPVQRSKAPSTAANYAPGAPGLFERIRMRESGGNYATNTGNGYYGAYQFSLGTWQSVGGTGLPSEASPAEQDMRAQLLYARRGCSPWPNTCY